MKSHESTSHSESTLSPNQWAELAKPRTTNPDTNNTANPNIKDPTKAQLPQDTPEVRRQKSSHLGAKILAAYDASERHRVDRIKSELENSYSSTREYESRAAKAEPSPLKKVTRLLNDKLGIKSRKDERLREAEATRIALTEYHAEQAAQAKAYAEEEARREAKRLQREAERKAREARIEQEEIAQNMSKIRTYADSNKRERFQKQRIQELVEHDLNARLLKVADLEVESLSETPGIQKHLVNFEDTEIPIYDLNGLPFSILSTTIDYRKHDEPGHIGTETFRAVMNNPALWVTPREVAKQELGYGTSNANARGNTISASYYNSERNIASHVPGDLMYGFAQIDGDSIIYISHGDGGTKNMAGESDTLVDRPNIIKELEGASETSHYNEILLRRYSENGVPRRPDYIIVEDDNINDAALRHAKFFKIPIVNIQRQAYREKAYKRGIELINSISEHDSYQELDKKIEELTSMSNFKDMLRSRTGIGRAYDLPLPPLVGDTPLDMKCRELSQMEQLKRLDFLTETLEQATQSLESSDHKLSDAQIFPQFSHFSAIIWDSQNKLNRNNLLDNDIPIDETPGNPSFIEIDFQLKDSTRYVKTFVYDGENIPNVEEMLRIGRLTPEDIENADSSHYKKLEPIVVKYFEAYRKNLKKQG